MVFLIRKMTHLLLSANKPVYRTCQSYGMTALHGQKLSFYWSQPKKTTGRGREEDGKDPPLPISGEKGGLIIHPHLHDEKTQLIFILVKL